MPESNEIATTPRRASWYQRFFASAMASEQKTHQAEYDARKKSLLGELQGDVLEIGPGTGPNLAYYARDVYWSGIEPNPAMFSYVEDEAKRLGMSIDLREGRAERLDAADNRFDAVVVTLVLCSVRDPQQTLQEIRRVLKPGGRFVFIEHVAAPRHTGLRRFQRLIKPLWKPFSDGCNPDRETWTAIEQAGFSRVELEHFRIDQGIASPHIAGFAVK